MNFSGIPDYMHEQIKNYMEYGVPPGDFFYHILLNDLVGACDYADSLNLLSLPSYARVLVWELPPASWGDEKKVKQWIEMKGAKGP